MVVELLYKFGEICCVQYGSIFDLIYQRNSKEIAIHQSSKYMLDMRGVGWCNRIYCLDDKAVSIVDT